MYNTMCASRLLFNVPSKAPVTEHRSTPIVACCGFRQGDVAAILVGDGAEEGRLWPLTKSRCAAAIPISANYRLIDMAVSNCINSNVTKMFALTQFNSTSLNAHLNRAYSELLHVIAAYQSPQHKSWFQGNADAIRRCLGLMLQQEHRPLTHFLILPGHHLYRMDYNALIQTHKASHADITVSCVRPLEGAGSIRVDSDNIVVGTSSNEDVGCKVVASMGIYVMSKQVMLRILRDCFPLANDLERDVIPGAVSLGMKVKAYIFEGDWEGMDSVSDFYHTSMAMTKEEQITGYNFYDRECPLYTLPHCLPPTKIAYSLISNSVIGDGCLLNGFIDKEMNVPIGVGEGCVIQKAIIDKNARIGKRVMIINKDKVQEGSRQHHNYAIIDGIVVVMRSAVIPDNTVL
ncbi:hypothetical protein V2J09_012980 [Rumex salicifolius]